MLSDATHTPAAATTPTAPTDDAAMALALDAAARGPALDPNPRVGCVIVSADGDVAATGWHRGAGTPHAEVDALSSAGSAAAGGTAYVTLEPCNHHGRTPPCSHALLEAGVARVVYAVADPSPAAGGAAYLRGNAVEVTAGVKADEARALNAAWFFAREHGRPRVILKQAATLDGRIAARDGSSRWITGPEARADAHDLRARCGAILVGTGTVLADDPHLSVRDGDTLAATQPVRAVLGLRDVPPGARLRDDAAPLMQIRSRDPHEALTTLMDADVHQVLVEGGAQVASAFLRAGLVDEIVAYVAPALLGAGPATVADLGIDTIDAALRFSVVDVALFGSDVRIVAHPAPPNGREES